MNIIVDGFGGDNAPLEVLKGCAQAVRAYGVELSVTGSEQQLRKTAQENGISLEGIRFLEAPTVITMENSPRDVLRGKRDSSMAVGLTALKEGQGDAFVSAGNTGALVIGSMMLVGCTEGIRRPALAPILPTTSGCYMLLDGGANVECTPQMLAGFGVMGAAYMSRILQVKNPRVGLVNIGTEETKGGDLRREAYALLKEANCGFIGNVEPRELPRGVCDVAVADGFTGNVVLKLTEGVGLAFASTLKGIFMRSPLTKAAALLVRGGINDFKKSMDYSEYGGAPLMGIAKPVIKAHGSSNDRAFQNAVRQAVAFCKEDVIGEISRGLAGAQGTAQA